MCWETQAEKTLGPGVSSLSLGPGVSESVGAWARGIQLQEGQGRGVGIGDLCQQPRKGREPAAWAEQCSRLGLWHCGKAERTDPGRRGEGPVSAAQAQAEEDCRKIQEDKANTLKAWGPESCFDIAWVSRGARPSVEKRQSVELWECIGLPGAPFLPLTVSRHCVR